MADEWMEAYWEQLAVSPPPRVWSWGEWRWTPMLGGDERHRRTLVWGRWVFALWYCRCSDCKAHRARLAAIVDGLDE